MKAFRHDSVQQLNLTVQYFIILLFLSFPPYFFSIYFCSDLIEVAAILMVDLVQFQGLKVMQDKYSVAWALYQSEMRYITLMKIYWDGGYLRDNVIQVA